MAENRKKKEDALRKRIGDLAYEVTQNSTTERAYTGKYDHFFEKGLYVDVVSGEALFTSMDKYDSGCGWPAFTKPVNDQAVHEKNRLFPFYDPHGGQKLRGGFPSGACISRRTEGNRRASLLH